MATRRAIERVADQVRAGRERWVQEAGLHLQDLVGVDGPLRALRFEGQRFAEVVEPVAREVAGPLGQGAQGDLFASREMEDPRELVMERAGPQLADEAWMRGAA